MTGARSGAIALALAAATSVSHIELRVNIFSWLTLVHYYSCVKCNDKSDISLVLLLFRKNCQ